MVPTSPDDRGSTVHSKELGASAENNLQIAKSVSVRKELKNVMKLFEPKVRPATDVMKDLSHLSHGSAWS